jgi:hypothetical protein
MLQLEDKTKQKVDSGIRALQREFEGQVEEETIASMGQESLEDLLMVAYVPDFIPVLVRRFTRERLLEMTEEGRHLAA